MDEKVEDNQKQAVYVSVFENKFHQIILKDNWKNQWIVIDECMAEKLCDSIMTVACKLRKRRFANGILQQENLQP